MVSKVSKSRCQSLRVSWSQDLRVSESEGTVDIVGTLEAIWSNARHSMEQFQKLYWKTGQDCSSASKKTKNWIWILAPNSCLTKYKTWFCIWIISESAHIVRNLKSSFEIGYKYEQGSKHISDIWQHFYFAIWKSKRGNDTLTTSVSRIRRQVCKKQ